MLGFSPLLGTNLPLLGTRSSLATPSKFQSISASRFPLTPLIQFQALTLHSPLIRTSKLLTTNTDRSEIGWDNWNPLDSSLDLDSFDLSVEKDAGAVKRSNDRSDRLDSIDDLNSDFFTTIITPTAVLDRSPEPKIDREREGLSINPDDATIKSIPKKERSKSTKQSKSKLATQTLPDSAKLGRRKSNRVTPEIDTLIHIETNQLSIDKVDENKSIADGISELVSEDFPKLTSSIISSSLQIETALTPSNLLEVNTEYSKLDSDSLQIDPPTVASMSLLFTQLETTPVTPLAENIESVSELSSDRSKDDPRSIQPNVDPCILPRLLQPAETFVASSDNGVDAELREVGSGNSEIDPRSISTNIDPQVLAETALTSIQPQETATPSQRLEIASAPESKVSFSDLDLAPVSIPTNINSPPPAPISFPFSQLEPPLIDRLEVNTEFTSEVTSDRVQLDRVSIPTAINPPVLTSDPSSLPQEPRSIQSQQPEVTTDSIEVNSETLPVDCLPISTDIYSSIPVDLTPFPPLEEKIIALPQLEIKPESASKVISSNLPIDPSSISTEISPEVSRSNLFLSLRLEERVIPDRQIEIEPVSEAEVNSDDLQIDPPSISADINSAITPANLSLSSQLDVVASGSNQLEVNTEDSDLSLSNLQPDPQSNPPNITSISPLSLQKDSSSKPTDDRTVDIEGTSESSPDNLPLQISATKIINENSPIDATADPSLHIENISVEITNDSISQRDTTSKTDSNLQVTDDFSTQSEELLLSPVNSEENLKPSIPVRGYATGGYVKESDRVEPESIAASDTVAAMLTPGEFVINAKDARKNLNLLTHINSGGEPDTSIGSQTPTISTYNPLTSIQAKIQNSTLDNSLQRQVDLHQISFLNPSQLNDSTNSPTESNRSATNYYSPDLIFRQRQSDRRTEDNTIFRTPDEWENIEELMNGGNYNSDSFNFNDLSRDSPPSSYNKEVTTRSIASSSPAIAPKMSPATGADTGEVTPPDISREIEPIVQTITAPISTNEQQSNDAAELEILAREIYHRLRQRLEIERERHGSYSGNLSW